MRIITRAELETPTTTKCGRGPGEEVPPIGGTNRDFMLNHPLARGEDDPMQILASSLSARRSSGASI